VKIRSDRYIPEPDKNRRRRLVPPVFLLHQAPFSLKRQNISITAIQ